MHRFPATRRRGDLIQPDVAPAVVPSTEAGSAAADHLCDGAASRYGGSPASILVYFPQKMSLALDILIPRDQVT